MLGHYFTRRELWGGFAISFTGFFAFGLVTGEWLPFAYVVTIACCGIAINYFANRAMEGRR